MVVLGRKEILYHHVHAFGVAGQRIPLR